ncbi:MAG TPA: alpha/beta hydrolase [Opitutaceae bacterium]|nr:alpha/beta hydrolase [Opitutaceae bacterium]
MKLLRLPTLLVLTCGLAAAAAAERPVVVLWPNGAPGSEARKHEAEKVVGSNISNIHNPSLLVYLPPKEQATGCAVIVAPGGGHQRLVIQHEGYNVGEWLASHGIAAFVLKNRLARDDANPAGTPQPYTIERDALADAQRAIRIIRARAQEWGVNPSAVGIIGFSAGGEIAAWASMRFDAGKADATDPIDRLSCRPDFQGLIYPGQSGKIVPIKESPPAFLACGYGDRPDISEGLAKVYLLFKGVGVPAELHIYAGAGHGFGVRDTNKTPSGAWPERFREWLVDRKFIAAPKS